MSIGFFIIGGIIFLVYVYFTIWNIYYSGNKQKEENYPKLNTEKENKIKGSE
jgi:hypothetical protein